MDLFISGFAFGAATIMILVSIKDGEEDILKYIPILVLIIIGIAGIIHWL